MLLICKLQALTEFVRAAQIRAGGCFFLMCLFVSQHNIFWLGLPVHSFKGVQGEILAGVNSLFSSSTDARIKGTYKKKGVFFCLIYSHQIKSRI